jgi:hypothetical protein
MKRMAICLLMILLVASTGCISTRVTPVEAEKIGVICIRKNPIIFQERFITQVRDEFRRNLIQTRFLEHGLEEKECFCIMEYIAHWEWHITFYLSYAKLELYRNDRLIGSAEYDATRAGLALTKYISEETIISQLVEEILNVN